MSHTLRTLSFGMLALMLSGCASQIEVNRLQVQLDNALTRATQAEQAVAEAQKEIARNKQIAEEARREADELRELAQEAAEKAENKSGKKVFIQRAP